MKRLFYFTLVLPIILLSLSGCAPVFSELQSARTVGKGNFEYSGAYCSVYSRHQDGKIVGETAYLGLQMAHGLTDGIDLRARYEFAFGNVLAVGPKFSIIRDRMAVYIPIGFAFGPDVRDIYSAWQTHPTLLVTLPLDESLDINPSFKVILPFEKEYDNGYYKREYDTLFAVNLGIGLRISQRCIIRPEYGLLFNYGESKRLSQFSLGVTLTPRKGLKTK